jgi:hypothetical protein
MSFLRKMNETTMVDEPMTSTSTSTSNSTSNSNSMNEQMSKSSPKLTSSTKSSQIDAAAPFLPPEFVEELRNRWDSIQISFVDEPRDAVKQANELVASASKKIAESFAEARTNLEGQIRGDGVDTEDLRIAMKKYRSLFQKLSAV